MTDPNPPKSRQDALAALAWMFDAGIDTIVESEPRNWLAPPPEAPAAPKSEPRSASQDESCGTIARAANLDELRAAIEAVRPKPTLSDGDPTSGVMIVGEGPSADDLATGRPFSGSSGALLDRMLKAIGRDRSGCYLANLVLWRNPAGRPASREEVEIGRVALRRHIELVRPRALLIMGGMPAKALFETDEGITKLRGRWQDLALDGLTVPALPTFNPAYLLRVPQHKGLAWADLLAFKVRIDAD